MVMMMALLIGWLDSGMVGVMDQLILSITANC